MNNGNDAGVRVVSKGLTFFLFPFFECVSWPSIIDCLLLMIFSKRALWWPLSHRHFSSVKYCEKILSLFCNDLYGSLLTAQGIWSGLINEGFLLVRRGGLVDATSFNDMERNSPIWEGIVFSMLSWGGAWLFQLVAKLDFPAHASFPSKI